MKHLLIPTDFTIQSLNVIHKAVAMYGEEQLNITLFHLLHMPADIPALLFPSLRNKHFDMAGEEFNEACEILQNRYSSVIKKLRVRFGYGNTRSYVQNFVEGAGIDKVILCPDVSLALPSKHSVDMMPLLRHPLVPFIIVNIKNAPTVAETNKPGAIQLLTGNELRLPKTEKYVAQN